MAERFLKQVTTSEVHQTINNAVPENTKKATKFTVKMVGALVFTAYLAFCL